MEDLVLNDARVVKALGYVPKTGFVHFLGQKFRKDFPGPYLKISQGIFKTRAWKHVQSKDMRGALEAERTCTRE